MSKTINALLGDTPGRVAVKLIIISLFVGIVMTLLGWTPMDVVWKIVHFFKSLWSMGFSSFSKLFDVIIVGAAIVVPAFIIIRLLSWKR
ncbi:DUF6460 domain-containing protein [Bartonella tamiae]|uniref:DUF6460 domain-containing protein n=1 Tax=Bartonella tamiae Th239 TaxID=1094558 RepID=J0R3V2_9HYPH|nr:DUF6460 domain-containing protein [Bartonella tamiae]EJF90319.1 hypothetical protein ME5_00720 [Bartonella tamiae Th239]EJF93740.1 hypothetical protein MEG_01164 [Bartonella tamiae Th307]